VVGLATLLLLSACGGALNGEIDDPVPADPGQVEQEPPPTEAIVEAEPTGTPNPTATVPATDEPPAAATEEASEDDYQIITLLPFDAIPAIDDPTFYDAAEADQEYHPGELVIGVEVDGDARAYSVSLLSRHEIVNDEIGGHPISVTW
jgi:hypothetical protein